jgi:hypothetical protein
MISQVQGFNMFQSRNAKHAEPPDVQALKGRSLLLHRWFPNPFQCRQTPQTTTLPPKKKKTLEQCFSPLCRPFIVDRDSPFMDSDLPDSIILQLITNPPGLGVERSLAIAPSSTQKGQGHNKNHRFEHPFGRLHNVYPVFLHSYGSRHCWTK